MFIPIMGNWKLYVKYIWLYLENIDLEFVPSSLILFKQVVLQFPNAVTL